MLVFYLECGFSLLPNRKSFARGTPFLLRDVKKCQYFFINDLVHLNPTLTQVERVLPKRSSQRVCCLILTAHPVAPFFIEHGQRAIVCDLRVFVRIADSGEACPSELTKCAYHVKHHASLARLIEMQIAPYHDIEEIVGSWRAVTMALAT